MTREIPLYSRKSIVGYALVDDADFDWLNRWRWGVTKGYASTRINRKTVLMHRLVNNTPADLWTDHCDGNRLNNQRYNLRSCTVQQNNMNRGPSPKSSSPYKGVSWSKGARRWQATIEISNKSKCIGYFYSERDAAAAYNAKAVELFGPYARLNDLSPT